MPFDPHGARRIALIILLLPLAWFAGLWFASDTIWSRLGMNMHAVTFFSMFVAVAATVAVLLFGRWVKIEDDLLAGRDVIARWQVDATSLAIVEQVTLAEESRDKATLIRIVLILVAIVFGGFIWFDPEAAPGMIGFGLAFAVVIWWAYRAGQARLEAQATMRSGEVIIGRHGLRYNGRLHVWGVPLSWLRGAAFETSPRSLVVGYVFLTRMGMQSVGVRLPVPATALDEARKAEKALNALAGAHPPP